MAIFSAYGAAIQGDRPYQEDTFRIVGSNNDAQQIAVLCDGMGGHAGGALASELVANQLSESLGGLRETPSLTFLEEALDSAHKAVINAVETAEAPEDMGTTVVAAVITKNDVHWVSVGDSLLYHYQKGHLRRLNADHSMAAVLDELADIGRMSHDEAQEDPRRNALRSCISADDIALVDAQSRRDRLKPGDKLILASDGLDTLSMHEVEKIIRRRRFQSPEKIVKALLNSVTAAEKPHQDNTTILCLQLNRWSFFN